MTLGDIIESTRSFFGGDSRDERELAQLREGLLSLKDLRAGERRKKDSLDQLIKDKQAELATTTLKQNQISLAKEILKLKDGLNELQKTEDEISSRIDVAEQLIHEKERQINAAKSKGAGIDIGKVESAIARREDRMDEDADLGKALEELNAVGSRSSQESEEDIDALLAAASSRDTVTVKPAAAQVDPAVEAMIAAAAAPTSASASPEANPGVAVPN